jgi:hypothetical protein
VERIVEDPKSVESCFRKWKGSGSGFESWLILRVVNSIITDIGAPVLLQHLCLYMLASWLAILRSLGHASFSSVWREVGDPKSVAKLDHLISHPIVFQDMEFENTNAVLFTSPN